jgi:hypothetical protein
VSGSFPRLAALLAAFLLALAAAPLPAQPAWSVLYRHGLQLESESRWAEALRAFHRASQEQPRAQQEAATPEGTPIAAYDPYVHMARCLLELGRPGEARLALRASYGAGVTPRAELQALGERIRQAGGRGGRAPLGRERPAHLSVTSDPPGAAVLLDGAPFGVTPTRAIEVPAGQHVVRVESDGYKPEEKTVTVEEGGSLEVDIALTAIPPPAAAPPPSRQRAARPTAASAKPAAIATPAPTIAPTPTAALAARPAPGATAKPGPRTAPTPSHRHPLVGLALLLIVAGGVTLWLVRRRTRRTPAPSVTAPTRIEELPTRMAEVGASLGGYELLGLLGRGGMATTYRARRKRDGATVAVKLPHEACLEDPTFVTRFLREGNLGEQLHHPNIVRILDTGKQGERPFLAMEMLAGRTLKQELRDRGPLPVRRALEIARDIAEALDYAHAKGVVHRDLKPENVMLLPDGQVRVMDFGIARTGGGEGLTSTNLFLGTPLYAAPEMVDPKSVDHRVDLYALGIILYEMLEGTVPFTADSPYRVLEMHLHSPLPGRNALARPVPEEVWAVITGLCEKDREKRTPSAERLLVELHRLLRDFSELEGTT